MKNILITGGAGFIGSNLALKLIRKGYKVTILDNLSQQIHGDYPEKTSPLYLSIKDKVRFIKGNVLSEEDWIKAIDNQEIIVHLASETGTGQSMYQIERYINVNIRGTALLLDILTNKKHTIKKIIVASSRAIYGEGKYKCKTHGFVYPGQREEKDLIKGEFDCRCPYCGNFVELQSTDENSKIHPTSIYGITKQNQEQMIMLMGRALGIPSVALRYQNVYGPGQSLTNPYTGILSIFSNLIRNDKEINIFEDGKESRDFVYIDDVVNATILSIESEKANNKIYNVGSNESVSVLSVARILLDLFNSNSKLRISGNFRIGDIRHNVADISKIKKDLGYKPKFPFNKGIKLFVKWVQKQDINDNDLYHKSIIEMKERGLYK